MKFKVDALLHLLTYRSNVYCIFCVNLSETVYKARIASERNLKFQYVNEHGKAVQLSHCTAHYIYILLAFGICLFGVFTLPIALQRVLRRFDSFVRQLAIKQVDNKRCSYFRLIFGKRQSIFPFEPLGNR